MQLCNKLSPSVHLWTTRFPVSSTALPSDSSVEKGHWRAVPITTSACLMIMIHTLKTQTTQPQVSKTDLGRHKPKQIQLESHGRSCICTFRFTCLTFSCWLVLVSPKSEEVEYHRHRILPNQGHEQGHFQYQGVTLLTDTETQHRSNSTIEN